MPECNYGYQRTVFQGKVTKARVVTPIVVAIFWQKSRQNLAAFLSKLHSFTKFLEINLKEPGDVPLSEITGRRSKLKENARPLSRNNDYTVEGDSPWLSESTPTSHHSTPRIS
jgi:hypothetical protein